MGFSEASGRAPPELCLYTRILASEGCFCQSFLGHLLCREPSDGTNPSTLWGLLARVPRQPQLVEMHSLGPGRHLRAPGVIV